MALPFFNWSKTTASNATADSTVNWAEGMAPSAVNDSGRAMMASTAAYRDDVAGGITTGGTSTAYTVTTYEVFDTLAHLNGQLVAFTPHTTNGSTVTLNVDGLGAKPLRSAPSVELVAGVLVQGTPYAAIYNSSDSAFYLYGFFGDPYSIPIGGSIDFWGASAPNSSFVMMYGQAISRTTYSSLFSLFSTAYGSGDGSTTFNLPDCRGRTVFGADTMGGVSAGRISGATLNGTERGAVGGSETRTLVTANLPAYTPSGTVAVTALVQNTRAFATTGSSDASTLSQGNTSGAILSNGVPFISSTAFFSGSAQGGTSTAFGIMPPAIVSNKILRII